VHANQNLENEKMTKIISQKWKTNANKKWKKKWRTKQPAFSYFHAIVMHSFTIIII